MGKLMDDTTTQIEPDSGLLASMLASERRRIITASNTSENVPRIITFVVAASIAWGHGNNLGVAIWTVIMIFLPGPAVLRPQWFYSLPERQFWAACTFIGGVAYPLCWTTLPILIMRSGSNTQMILLIFICITVVVRARVTAYNPPEMYAQILISCGSLALWQTYLGGEYWRIVVLTLFPFALALIAYGRSVYQELARTVNLNTRNLQLANQLRLANEAKTRFLASASHDLRQPLHAVGLLVGLLGNRVSEHETQQIVRHIESAVDSMENLLNAILNISRLDSGVEHPQIGPIAVRQLWQNLERNFGATAAQHGLRLRLRASDIWVASDEHLLLRILINLVGNAIRYTETGGILVAARRRGEQVVIEILDTGIGIPRERQDEVFQEFVQLHNTERDRTKGLGLGLSIVRRTVMLLGHTLEMTSEVDRGTRFRLTLPCVALPQEIVQNVLDLPLPDATGLFVLFVDDEQDVRFAMQALLTDWGCAVVTAANGEEAMAELTSRMRVPDALVLDYRLPSETGVVLAKRLQQVSETWIPTLIVTGDVTAGPLKDIQRSGLPVQHKPMNPSRLREWLGQVKIKNSSNHVEDPVVSPSV
jgi:signal transduction histidine kinase/CheY-like chemotaxis protein